MARKSLDLQHVVNALYSLRIESAVQLKDVVTEKMDELGLKHRGRHAMTATGTVASFNVRGVVDWIRNLSPPHDTCKIDQAEAESKGESYVVNQAARDRHDQESVWFKEDCASLVRLCATIHRRCGDAGHGAE